MQHAKNNDKDIIRRLATEIAEIAALPEQTETAELWRAVNDLKSIRPTVRIYQLPWRELDVNGELELQCQDSWARKLENQFRQTLYQWKYMRHDIVVEPTVKVPYAIHHTGFGISTQMEELPHDEKGGVTSKHYDVQIANEDDIEKIKFPTLTPQPEETKERVAYTKELLGDILDVVPQGRVKHSYSPWDRLAEWCSPEQVLMDLALRPDFIHSLMERLTSAYMHELDQLEEKSLLSISNGNYGVGEGGLGFTNELPDQEKPGKPVRLEDHWGGAMAQIFSEVSPEMHEEFALAYEQRLLNRFGLSYYGCCEPLDRKVDIVSRNILTLRKISMSPWVNPKRGAEAINGRFVYSAKPNPAFLATKGLWDRKSAEKELRNILEVTEGKNVELILKDVSTVCFEPSRVWEWCNMAMDLVLSY